MNYLVDSDWVASYLKGRPDAVKLLTDLSRNGLAISLITYGEIYDGIYHGSNPNKHEQVFLQFLRDVNVLSLDMDIMRIFAKLRGQLRASGQIIGDFDLLITATAIYHNLTLVTRNARHFGRIPGLSIY